MIKNNKLHIKENTQKQRRTNRYVACLSDSRIHTRKSEITQKQRRKKRYLPCLSDSENTEDNRHTLVKLGKNKTHQKPTRYLNLGTEEPLETYFHT